MSVCVVIPHRDGCPWRQRALQFTTRHLAERYDWPVVLGSCAEDRPFNRSAAILDGVRRTDADCVVVHDGDVFLDGDLNEAVAAAEDAGWAVPHELVHRLSPHSSELVQHGEPWRDLPLSTDNKRDSRPYRGYETGTLVVLRRGLFGVAPPDPRFEGWGHEDEAWSAALRCLVGPPWRGTADLVHLWHPPQPRRSRAVGSVEGQRLERRYRRARRDPHAMRALIEEGKR